jgi:hypothetical protein
MRFGLVVLLLPSVAMAEPREVVVSTLLGGSAAAPPESDVEHASFAPMLGGTLTWEPALPRFADDGERVAIAPGVAPQLAISMHGSRAMVLAGARLELAIHNRRFGGVITWLAPSVGAITGATSYVVGGELGQVFPLRDGWRIGYVYGGYTWRQPLDSMTAPRSTMPAPPDHRTLQGQLAFVIGRAL